MTIANRLEMIAQAIPMYGEVAIGGNCPTDDTPEATPNATPDATPEEGNDRVITCYAEHSGYTTEEIGEAIYYQIQDSRK